MKLKKAILEVMDTDLLRGVLYTLEIEAEDRRSRDSMIAALSRSKQTPADKLIEFIGEAQVKEVCEMVGVDSRGRRGVLIDRLLESGSENDPQVKEEPTPSGDAPPPSPKWKVGQQKTVDYRHKGEKRKNIPPANMAGEGKVPKVEKVKYQYNPHLPPVLRFDPDGTPDKFPDLIAKAGRCSLKPDEQLLMAEALKQQEPWLEWAGKKEQHDKIFFEVDPVALHIHERVSAQACIRAAMREDAQRDLFADPEQPYKEAVQFYRHDIDWANRLILGDSLQVMSSLANREGLTGKVQMIYIDPPYGIKFASNFQPEMGKREVKEKEQDLTRESEVVKAYRDTWELGIHSYLSYLRDRLIVARNLLGKTGSIFIQINDENLHQIRNLLDDVFGRKNFISLISFQKTGGFISKGLVSTVDYICWYAKDIETIKINQMFEPRSAGDTSLERYDLVYEKSGELRRITQDERKNDENSEINRCRLIALESANPTFLFSFQGKEYVQRWKTNFQGLMRLAAAERLSPAGQRLTSIRYLDDFNVIPLTDRWESLQIGKELSYVVQTAPGAIERCMLMSTDPGDLVLDPTCGGGTTAFVAEQWGRRWITIDTSRVAVAISRQRLLTAKYEYYKLKESSKGPAGGFLYKTAQHIKLKSIAQNTNLDPISARHGAILEEKLAACNKALGKVGEAIRSKLKGKLFEKQKQEGKRAITEADSRRWELPEKFEHWTVPFDTDIDWPKGLQEAVTAYRNAWRVKMDEVNACIVANAEHEELVDQPEIVRGILRVSGPFTVEGVMPEELNIGEDGLFDGTPNSYGLEEDRQPGIEPKNMQAYLTRMVQSLRSDGVTFLNNKRKMFARLEPLFENGTGSLVHAEGVWDGGEATGPCMVAVSFGPQYGPVTVLQVEEVIRASKRFDDLVIAGFSFDPEAGAVIQENIHPKLRIHQAYIRPDINPGMDGLLKVTPNSQLFTVFGQPDVEVKKTKDGDWVCELLGVDIYDPLTSTIRSTGAGKVAAWFLDSDYDGRCFCITQAFFPDQDAWDKIAKALKGSADTEAFEKFKGTKSLPFPTGKYNRIAVKVIDPRGNEVMAIRQLKG